MLKEQAKCTIFESIIQSTHHLEFALQGKIQTLNLLNLFLRLVKTSELLNNLSTKIQVRL
jgi:hypothetical protein